MSRPLRIKLLVFENGISCVGFRRISSVVKRRFPDTVSYVYDVKGATGSSILNFVFSRYREAAEAPLNPAIVDELSDADVVGISCVSLYAGLARRLIEALKARRQDQVVVWGGVHATVFPDDAIQHADAVCIGEGEKSFPALLDRLAAGQSIEDAPGFWVRRGGEIRKNPLLPLLTPEEMAQMPFQDYGFDLRYVTSDAIVPMTKAVYAARKGTSYMTMWVLGCPYRCTYCSNDSFLDNDPANGKTRHPPVDYLIAEMKAVLAEHDYVRYVEIVDDNVMLVKLPVLQLFSERWRREIGLSLSMPGVHPNTANAEKLEILVAAGLRKVRMGIQSGSEATLAFYRRNTSRAAILRSARALDALRPRILPPNYDIIIDNPLETDADKEQTLELLRELPRPFMLFVYSLRALPGTKLWEHARAHPEHGIQPSSVDYQRIFDRRMGLLVFVLGLYRPSAFGYRIWSAIAANRVLCRLALPFVRIAYLARRAVVEAGTSNLEPLAALSPTLARLAGRLVARPGPRPG